MDMLSGTWSGIGGINIPFRLVGAHNDTAGPLGCVQPYTQLAV